MTKNEEARFIHLQKRIELLKLDNRDLKELVERKDNQIIKLTERNEEIEHEYEKLAEHFNKQQVHLKYFEDLIKEAE